MHKIVKENERCDIEEQCPHCDSVVGVIVDPNDRSMSVVCPVCHNTMMLCTMCRDLWDNCNWKTGEGCRYNSKKKRYVPMNIDKFTDLLLNLKTGETIWFALGSEVPSDHENIPVHALFDWTFAKKIYVREADAHVVIVAADGGDNVYAFNVDEDDPARLPDKYYMRHIRDEAEFLFFDKWNLKGDDKYDPCVFIEMEAV